MSGMYECCMSLSGSLWYGSGNLNFVSVINMLIIVNGYKKIRVQPLHYMIDDHGRQLKTTTTITTNIWLSKRDNPTVIRYRRHRWPRRERACERVRAGPRCSSTLTLADSVSRCVSSARATRVSPSLWTTRAHVLHFRQNKTGTSTTKCPIKLIN